MQEVKLGTTDRQCDNSCKLGGGQQMRQNQEDAFTCRSVVICRTLCFLTSLISYPVYQPFLVAHIFKNSEQIVSVLQSK